MLQKGHPEKIFDYVAATKGIFEETAKLRALKVTRDLILHYEMEPVAFDSARPGYSEARSIFAPKDQNVSAGDFPDVPLVFLRAPNGSGKTFASERDMAVQVLGQSIGYAPAKKPRLRVYDTIWMQGRLRSSHEKDSDPGALGIESRSLDDLFRTLKERPNRRALVYLDETGATTDEKSEHRIMRAFVDSVRKTCPNVDIRFSTHNQPLIDEMRERSDPNIAFRTFTDAHELIEGERDSDTVNAFSRLLAEWDEEIRGYAAGDVWRLNDAMDAFLRKLAGPVSKKWYDIPKKSGVLTEKWPEFQNFWRALVAEMTDGGIKLSPLPESVKGVPTQSIRFPEEIRTELAERTKGVRDGIFPSMNQRFDLQVASIEPDVIGEGGIPRGHRELIGRTYNGFHHFEYLNHGSEHDRYEALRVPPEVEYR